MDFDEVLAALELPMKIDNVETKAYISSIVNRYARGELTKDSDDWEKIPECVRNLLDKLLVVWFSNAVVKL